MENYKLSFQDTFLGTLTVDTDTGKYVFNRISQAWMPWRKYGITRIISFFER